MDKKPYLQSNTIRSCLIIVVIVVMNMLGIGEQKPGQTYDSFNQETGVQMDKIKDIVLLMGAGGAAFGRMNAKTELKTKKELENEK